VDWAILVTGVVGIAGIGGTLLSAKMTSKSAAENLRTSIAAEDARAKLAEKRRIYANCMAALTACASATDNTERGTDLPPAQFAELLEELSRTRQAAMNATYEVQLIGPIEVARLTNRAIRALLDSAAQAGDIAEAVAKLTRAMRRDLGEDVPPREQDEMPDVAGLPSH
jgi:hypothetical protein